MKKLKNFTISIISFVMISNCGFTVQDSTKVKDFSIGEIQTIGEKRINFKLKNKFLIYSNDESKRILNLSFDTKKNKTIKEKNIKNEITKYQIDISVKVKFETIDKSNNNEFLISKTGDYTVASKYSQTLNSEKKLIDLMTNQIADQIFYELLNRTNDL